MRDRYHWRPLFWSVGSRDLRVYMPRADGPFPREGTIAYCRNRVIVRRNKRGVGPCFAGRDYAGRPI